MDTTRTCPECHQPLSADAPDGLCPQCLMRAAAGPPPNASSDGLPGDIIDIGDPAEVAKKLPQFEILELLGRGGMGVVYKARQLQLDRIIALKILPPVDALSADFVARFTREARALAKLNHPNIVSVHDFGETGGLYYIVMEFVDGANLRQLQETRRLTPVEALAIVPKICDALQYAHEEGLVHRDIKPENLLIDKKGRIKIADFGLAKMLRREPLDMTLTLSGMALGTMRYMAPEQMDKPETVDHRADIYSLGVVIYEMLTGQLPTGHFELPSQKAQVDPRLDGIVLHALEHDVERRYQHASEVRDDVEQVTSKPQPAQLPSSSSTTGIAEDNTPAQPSKPLPSSWWRAFGSLMLGWLAVGALWNFRTPGCLLGSLVMAGIVFEIMICHSRRNPRWVEAWRKLNAPLKIFLFGICNAGTALAFMMFINAMIVRCDTSSDHWNNLAQSQAEFEAAHKGKEYQLIRALIAFKDQVPTTELSYRFSGWRGDSKFWGESGPYNEYFKTMSLVESLLIGTLIIYFVVGFHQRIDFPSTPHWLWQRSKIGGFQWHSVASAVLASVVCAYGLLWFLPWGFPKTNRSSMNGVSVHATMEQVEAALNGWAAANGYTPGDKNEWDLLTVPKGEAVAHAGVFTAWKPSPFDRWHMTWSGLQRPSPHIAVHIVSSEKPAQSSVELWLQDDGRQSEQSIFDSLSEAISKSPGFDPSKLADAKTIDKPGDASGDYGPHPRLLLFGFLGLTLLWTTIRVRLADRQLMSGIRSAPLPGL